MLANHPLPMFWRVCLTNGLVFTLGTLTLVLSPATVSAQPLWSEVAVLTVGLAVIAVLNAMLIRSLLRPLDRLVALMASIDLRRPGRRLAEAGAGPSQMLVEGFNEMLGRLEAERATSTTRALQAQEAERHRIAQELHDEVGQSLTAVLLTLSEAIRQAPPTVSHELEAARETTRTSLDEVRRISQRLRPGVLDDLGLMNSLSSLASDLRARTEIHVRRSFAPGLPDLSRDVELVVYRVAQEALTNVARHAVASEVELGMSRVGKHVVLHVEDNGVGIGDRTTGAGIQGMQERARMVGGALEVFRRPLGGTTVRLTIPTTGVQA